MNVRGHPARHLRKCAGNLVNGGG